jgi:lipopolysaccharide biosynthesis glycosyltransferase
MQQKQHKVAEGIIPVVASSDDNYAYPLGVMSTSLLENTKRKAINFLRNNHNL